MEINNFKNNKIIKAWELNERHYGNLTGLNKEEMKEKLSEEKVHKLRRSWDYPPEKLDKKVPIIQLTAKFIKIFLKIAYLIQSH